ncbi:hypothetical protein psageK4_100c [Pseudomonas phage psageK4]|uniref:Uncharacterized protein n=2 Tax=Otagovirus TaxID=2560197 RepID=A0AAE8XLU9_9CAUD|nr:hypothetical protein QGX14_gp135 [Pseudomonas phage psageK4]YP_010767015.1 hypothetical protein QGX15_gp137 [Pseudomonas phage psageK4e]QXV71754.1 hypothetical protein psageK4_100c [Pseudomonas phage psageK4]UAW53558.1 hypothetical protein psageK4e_110c [Pseudomonas phage psageK4e]
MYDQAYIDALPTLDVGAVCKLKKKERIAIRHFKGKLGCRTCACTLKTVSLNTGKIECSNCLKQFKGLELPFRQVTRSCLQDRGMNPIKLAPTTVGGINARQSRSERFTSYVQRTRISGGIPIVYGGMNTK